MASSRQSAVVIETLKDIVTAEEGKTINLDCKLSTYISSGKWYKNGTLLVSCDKTKISRHGLWQNLEIKSVNADDQGVYSFVIKETKYTYTKCILFMKPKLYDNVTYNFLENIGQGVGVQRNLLSVKITEGRRFKLHAEFATSVESCRWFKNNHPVHPRYPRSLLNEDEHSMTEIYFDNAESKHSGIYLVVAKTYKKQYLTSYADVLIGNNYIKGLFNTDTIRGTRLEPPEFKDVLHRHNVRVLFKVAYDRFAIIEWKRNRTEVKYSDKIKCETYCNLYIALIIGDIRVADSGKYYLIIRHKLFLSTLISATRLTVKKHELRPTKCTVTESLLSAIVGIGNGVTFRASFNVPEPQLNYVVWIVGYYDIEKSSTKFKVVRDGSTFILHIPVVTPEMNGEVSCQLRQYLPTKQSIMLCATTGYLTVVPLPIMEEVKKLNITINQKKVYSESSISIMAPVANLHSGRMASCFCDDVILEFQFCRLSGGCLFFDVVNKDVSSGATLVKVAKKAVPVPNALFPTPGDWSISWDTPNKIEWYAFDACESNGQYSLVGISNSSSLDIKEPPEDKLFKFRVRRLRPKQKRRRHQFYYVPEELKMNNSQFLTLLSHKEYKKEYSDFTKIGSGSYGSINTMYSRNGEILVSKSINSSNKMKQSFNRLVREFEILKSLSHPNTITIINGFLKPKLSGYIISMEYLWGGELLEVITDRGSLTEVDVIVYVRQVLLALQYLHSKKIAHLDIKPQNILFENRNSRTIKLIDFGMARIIEQPVELSAVYGSRDFVSPEMIKKEKIGLYCDMWALGVLTYWLLTGLMPFIGRTWMRKSRTICQGFYTYNDTHQRSVSDRAKCFVSYLIRCCPEQRMTAVRALKNHWITRGPSEGYPTKKPVPRRGGVIVVSVSRSADEHWRMLIFQVLAVVRFRAQLGWIPYNGRRRFSARLLVRRLQEAYKVYEGTCPTN